MTQIFKLTLSLACWPLALLACSDDPLSLGTNEQVVMSFPPACPSGTVEGDVRATTQAQLAELDGCLTIVGSLTVSGTPGDGLSLQPLSWLRLVTGSLEVDGLETLAGLDALEQVGNLTLRNLGERELSHLSGLTRVIWDPPGSGDGGVINIADNPNLNSLGGLGWLTSWQRLYVLSNPQLQRLEHLSGPTSVAEVILYDLPQLDRIGLGFLRAAEVVNIEGTALRDLEGFPLAEVEHLGIVNNLQLESLDSLPVISVGSLSITDNPRLMSVRLARLEEVHAIRIANNASLQEVPLYETSSFQGITIGNEPIVRLSEESFEISNNAQLTRITLPETFAAVQQVVIWDNPLLAQVDLNDLARADGLTIVDNPVLALVLANSLERVGDLQLLDNPSLSVGPFAEVKTFSSSVRGNLDGPLTQLPGAAPAATEPGGTPPAEPAAAPAEAPAPPQSAAP